MNDRKKRILEHLKQSTDGTQYIAAKKTSEPVPPPPPTPEPTPEPKPVSKPTLKQDRKQKIMGHVNRSSENFGSFSLKDDSKKKKIEEHIRKSLS
ncbi:hypothetical protein [Crocosphaera sp.]|uniref:hypothetical protein n=1 Tax=Crocosphaera sp. TaxID=2729996 RepID=UPI003F23D201|nr:hypothetical protein [Crocosphaera sp.]